MSPAPVAADAPASPGRDPVQAPCAGPARVGVQNRVLALLVTAAGVAALAGSVLSVAPNRLVSGQGVALAGLLHGPWWALLLPAAALVAAVAAAPRPAVHIGVALAAAAGLAGLLALVGSHAAGLAQTSGSPSLTRVSLGAGCWALALLAGLATADALQRLRRVRPRLGRSALAAASAGLLVLLLAPLAALLAAGRLDELSLLKEYHNRAEVFQAAGWRHLQIVASALAAALVLGLPLGWAAARGARIARPLLAALNVIQTVPAVALFGLLIVPLAWLGGQLPGWGIAGIGLWPAVIALGLYALLPVVHGLAAGLQQVAVELREAGRGQGLSPRQLFWRLELPLAAPVLVSGLRVAAVQSVGLAVLAALIGAGGFGALVFQGLLGSANDLVLLGVLPVVALALAVDALFVLLGRVVAGPVGPDR